MQRPRKVFNGNLSKSSTVKRKVDKCVGCGPDESALAVSSSPGVGDATGLACVSGVNSEAGAGSSAFGGDIFTTIGTSALSKSARSQVPGGRTACCVHKPLSSFVDIAPRSAIENFCFGAACETKARAASQKRGPSHKADLTNARSSGSLSSTSTSVLPVSPAALKIASKASRNNAFLRNTSFCDGHGIAEIMAADVLASIRNVSGDNCKESRICSNMKKPQSWSVSCCGTSGKQILDSISDGSYAACR
mmetsp:Transcript_20016/g.32415  ORF Transcript_20016/g.32415 Transcript_20016/m.32415 type:complete len:249 (-) Transcript_20016:376-1122(-)